MNFKYPFILCIILGLFLVYLSNLISITGWDIFLEYDNISLKAGIPYIPLTPIPA